MEEKIKEARRFFQKYFEIFDVPKMRGVYFWIGGGAIRSYFLDEIPNDIDFHFTSQSGAKLARDLLLRKGFSKVESTKTHWKMEGGDLIFDLCYPYNSIEEWSNENADYTVNASALDRNLKFYCHDNFFEDVKNKKLRRMRQTNKWVGQMCLRLKKLLEYGFEIDKENLIKFLDDLEATRQMRADLKNKKMVEKTDKKAYHKGNK
jgi:hypothetical protein